MAELKLSTILPNNSIGPFIPQKKESTVYVEPSNNKSALEMISYNNDVDIGLSSLNFGATNTFFFNKSYQLLKECVLEVRMDLASVFKSDYFAYSLIDNIRWNVGGTELLRIDGQSLLPIVLSQCKSQQKRQKVLHMAGKRTFTTVGKDVQTNGTLANLNNVDRTFHALIPFPWSNYDGSTKPFPLHMLATDNLQCQITWRAKSDILEAGIIEQASIKFRYAKFGDAKQAKQSVYKWPFVSNFSDRKEVALGGTSIDLAGFRKGEIQQLLFYAVPNTTNTGLGTLLKIDSAGLLNKRRYDGIKLTNLRLTFNGRVIWQADNKLQDLWNMVDDEPSDVTEYNPRISAIVNKLANEPIKGRDVGEITLVQSIYAKGSSAELHTAEVGQEEGQYGRYRFYRIPMAEIKLAMQKAGYYPGVDFSKNTLKLSFDAPQAVNDINSKTVGNVPAVFFFTTQYRSMYQFTQDQTLLIF